MQDLLSIQDLNEISKAFDDLRATFLKSEIVYYRFNERVDTWGEDTPQGSFEPTVLTASFVEAESVGTKAQAELKRIGKQDLSEGMVLLYHKDLVTAGLADATKVFLRADQDYFEYLGDRYEIIGVSPIPDLSTLKSFVEVHYRKVLTAS